jgi:hypothetical protein
LLPDLFCKMSQFSMVQTFNLHPRFEEIFPLN